MYTFHEFVKEIIRKGSRIITRTNNEKITEW